MRNHVSAALPSLAACLLGLLASGCASQRETAASLETLVQTAPTRGGPLSPGSAALRLPAHAGKIAAVTRTSSGGAVRQDIMIEAGGALPHNRLAIVMQSGGVSRSAASPSRPSEAGIRQELAVSFPGQSMTVVAAPRRNAFGPYGLAVGSGPGGLRCAYAWQWLDGGSRVVADRLGGEASWRARICRSDRSLDQIAADLDQIDIGARHGEVAPSGTLMLKPVIAARRAAPKVARIDPPRQPVAQSSVDMPAAPGGLRYLAPVVGAQATAPAASPGTSMRPVSGALDAGLPPEAYRGPVTISRPQAARLAEASNPVLVPAPE